MKQKLLVSKCHTVETVLRPEVGVRKDVERYPAALVSEVLKQLTAVSEEQLLV